MSAHTDRTFVVIASGHIAALIVLLLLGVYVDWRFIPPAVLLPFSLAAFGWFFIRREGHR